MQSLPLLLSLFLSLPVHANPAGNPSARQIALTQSATVVNTIKAPPYTYLEVSAGKQTRWLASTAMAVKTGDVVHFDDGLEMRDFHSKTLNRTFPSILFVNKLVVSPAR